MKSIVNFLLCASFLVASVAHASVPNNSITPDALVKKTAEEVLTIIKSDKEIQAGNQQKLYAVAQEKILPNFDFDRVCRMVLGKNWKIATLDQQAGFQKEFRNLLLRTYATALSKYKNQTIEYKPFRSVASNNVTVKTQILQSGGQPIEVDYTLFKGDSGWKVYDIVIENVSLVTNYRSQFSNEIRQNGIDSLIKKLADKNKSAGL